MPEPQLSVRSARAKDLAHRLAARERRSIANSVERALESYEMRELGREASDRFYARLAAIDNEDIDLAEVIRQSRRDHPGLDL